VHRAGKGINNAGRLALGQERKKDMETKSKLAINGGTPVRTKAWPAIYPGGTLYDQEEVQAAIRVLEAKSPFRHYGENLLRQVDALEKSFSEFIGTQYTLGVSSGSVALTCALGALGIGPGSEVILPALMWISDVNSVVQLRGIPVICDIDETWNIDPKRLESFITPRTKAIVAIHMAGSPADIEAICAIGKKHNIPVLEDCSQAAGGTIKGKKLGSFGDIATFSMQYNKNLTTGEGGLITTNTEILYRKCQSYQDVGFERDKDGISKPMNSPYESFGIGCRLDEIRGAVGVVQVKKLPRTTSLMRGHQQSIKSQLKDIQGFKWRTLIDPDGDSGPMLGWILPSKDIADRFRAAMKAEGIPVSTPPGGVHQYRYMSNLLDKLPFTTQGCPWSCPFNQESNMNYTPDMLPISNDILDRSIGLNIPPLMSVEDENDVVAAFRKVAAELLA
jgi:8-amino-3,8-dideoxy-alpha-D-manno-octulosonate transaminase